jgi:hypothetical protein
MTGCTYGGRLVTMSGDEGGIKIQQSSPLAVSFNSGHQNDTKRQEITYILKLLKSNLQN